MQTKHVFFTTFILSVLQLYQIKTTYSLYSLYYAEAYNELSETISASLRPGNTACFEEICSGGETLETLGPI